MKISYRWLCELVPLTLAPEELARKMTMVGLAVDSVERERDDYILDFDLTSNRPDALSHAGIAREAAVISGSTFTGREVKLLEAAEEASSVASVEIQDPVLCPRYAARIVRGTRTAPSPKWLVERLEAIGQRSVNNIADITNYVMFELGQPTHAFDLNLLHRRKIVVRRAREGERLTTLDGVERELTAEMLVIADADRPVAIAGVMGGQETEINPDTTDVLIESAYFNSASVRQTSRDLGLDSEASYRFARGVDYEGQVRAVSNRAIDRAASGHRQGG
jgi:phenylalanyl-tRNA synthetase beta chain